MTQLTCQDCGEKGPIVTPRELEEGLAEGRYVNGSILVTRVKPDTGEQFTTSEAYVLYICRDCKRKAAKDAHAWQAHPEEARHRRIMHRLAHIRERSPEMSLEEAVMRTTDDEFEPENEPDIRLRRYLMDRGEQNAHADEGAREVLRQLEEVE